MYFVLYARCIHLEYHNIGNVIIAGDDLQSVVIAFKVVIALYKRLAGGLHYFQIVRIVFRFREESFQREVRKRVHYIRLHIVAALIYAGATV